MNENAITQKVLRLMNSVPGCYSRKRHGGAFCSGDPDIAGVAYGRAFFCEMKVAGGELSKLQAVMLDKWSAAGADTSVAVYSPETKKIRVIHLHQGCTPEDDEHWVDFAGPIDKIDGGFVWELNPAGVSGWVESIPDCMGVLGGDA